MRKLVVFMIRSLTLSSSFLPCVWDCIGEVELGNKKKTSRLLRGKQSANVSAANVVDVLLRCTQGCALVQHVLDASPASMWPYITSIHRKLFNANLS